jgi:hypothetical protein
MSATPKSVSSNGTASDDVASNTVELETGRPENSVEIADPDVVDWNGPEDKADPQNWTSSKKWLHIIIVSLLALVT